MVNDRFNNKTVMLQFRRPGDSSPLKFPAQVRNLVAGVVTLEINNPWTILNWGTLRQQGARLQLLSEARNTVEIQGTVSWIRYIVTDQSSGQLSLGLKLDNPDDSSQRLIKDHILHTSADIKSLWDRVDQARETPRSDAISTRISFVALILLCGALALNLKPGPHMMLSWVLWLGGTVAVAKQTLQFWRTVKESQ